MCSLVSFYHSSAATTALPTHPLLSDLPKGPGPLRSIVQGLVLHREWAETYGVEAGALRVDEQNLRSAAEVLEQAFEISAEPAMAARQPVDRVVGICWHFAVLYAALLRAQSSPVRVRCGFAGYFDAAKWYDHWITERWDGERWIRDDPQIDALQAETLNLDFDPHNQPPGRFLTGGEAWLAARAGEVDAEQGGSVASVSRSVHGEKRPVQVGASISKQPPRRSITVGALGIDRRCDDLIVIGARLGDDRSEVVCDERTAPVRRTVAAVGLGAHTVCGDYRNHVRGRMATHGRAPVIVAIRADRGRINQ